MPPRSLTRPAADLNVVDLEVGEREGVAWTLAATVDTDGCGAPRHALGPAGDPTLALGSGSRLGFSAEHASPEAECPLGVVGGELDQCETGVHDATLERHVREAKPGVMESKEPMTRDPGSRRRAAT